MKELLPYNQNRPGFHPAVRADVCVFQVHVVGDENAEAGIDGELQVHLGYKFQVPSSKLN